MSATSPTTGTNADGNAAAQRVAPAMAVAAARMIQRAYRRHIMLRRTNRLLRVIADGIKPLAERSARQRAEDVERRDHLIRQIEDERNKAADRRRRERAEADSRISTSDARSNRAKRKPKAITNPPAKKAKNSCEGKASPGSQVGNSAGIPAQLHCMYIAHLASPGFVCRSPKAPVLCPAFAN